MNDIHHSQYVVLSVSGSADFFLPIPAAVDRTGEWESTTSVYLSVTNNYALSKFSIGYGLWYGWNTWRFDTDYSAPLPHEPIVITNRSLGLIFPAHYLLTRGTYLSVVYRPGILQFGSQTKVRYEHLISVGLVWRLNLY